MLLSLSEIWRGGVLPVLFLLTTLAACHDRSAEPLIRVGTNVWPGYETLYLARGLGYLDANRVRMVELVSASDVMDAFRDNNLEAAALTLDEALTLAAEGVDLRVILIMDISNGADALVARAGIDELADLKGKRVGYEQTAVGAVMLNGALQKANLEFSDIEPRHLTVDRHLRAFARNEIDALITFEPVTTELVKQHARVLFSSADIPGQIVDVLVVRPELLNIARSRVEHLIDAQFKALRFLRRNPEDAARIMAQRMSITPRELLVAFDRLVLPDREHNQRLFVELGANALQLRNILFSTGLIAARPDISRLIRHDIVAGR